MKNDGLKQYQAKYTFTFNEWSFGVATRANIWILRILKSIFKEIDVEIECESLKEVGK